MCIFESLKIRTSIFVEQEQELEQELVEEEGVLSIITY